MEYITMSGGGGGDSFDIAEFADSWGYILGAVLGMFVVMALFIQWQNR